MIDMSIPEYQIFMYKDDTDTYPHGSLPEGFSFKLYEEGDEVVKYAALPYPVIVSRKVNLSVCPACGNIRPRGGDICSECACILENTSESY